ALTSMLSTPTPARPMIFSFPGLANVSALILLAERTPTPWYCPITDASSSGFIPVLTSTEKPALLRTSTAFLDMSSAIRTRIGSDMASFPSFSPPPGLGERRLCRRDPGARPNAEPEIRQRHLQPRNGGDDVELAHVPDVGDAHDLPLQVILPTRDRDAVTGPHLLDPRRPVDAVRHPEAGDRVDRRRREQLHPQPARGRARRLGQPLVAVPDAGQRLFLQ